MKNVPPTVALGVALVLAAGLSPGCRSAKPPPRADLPLRAGAAEVDVTPPVGHRMAGYFDERLATGTHDPLKAKAIVLQQGQRKIALVFCDLVGISLSASTAAREAASRQTGIPLTNILVAATHSHTGPLFDDVRRDFFHEEALAKYGRDPQEEIYYPVFLAERVAKAIVTANAQLSPAVLSAGTVPQTGLSFNRRYHMKDGHVRFNPGQLNPNIVRPAGPIDPEVGLLFVRDGATHRVLADLVVFACHCDTLGGTEYSADYPYFLAESLKQKFGPALVSAFAAGTCGDINHINVAVKDGVKGLPLTERIGTTLGQTVLRAEPGLHSVTKPTLAVRRGTLRVPLQEVTREQAANAQEKMKTLRGEGGPFMEKVEAVKALDLAGRGATWPMEVQVFRLDSETAIVGLPGEIFVELGLAIKKASPFKTTMVMSLCNDRLGYVPTRKAFAEGSYEVTNSRVKAGAGEQLVATAVEMLKQVKASNQ